MALTDDQKRELLIKAKNKGLTKEQAIAKINEYEASQEKTPEMPDTIEAPALQREGPFNVFEAIPEGPRRALFPSASQMPGETPLQQIGRGAIGGLDIADAPTRALATLRGQKMSEPGAAIFRPEIEKTKGIIEEKVPDYGIRTGGGLGGGYEIPLKPALKGVAEIAGTVASDPTLFSGLAKKAGKKLFGGGNKLLGRLASELSGVGEDALRLFGIGFGKGAKQLKRAAGTKSMIGDKLATAIDNFDDYLPEKGAVKEALDNMPRIQMENIEDAIDAAKVIEGSEAAITTNKKLERLKELWKNRADEFNAVDPKEFTEFRKQLDKEIKSVFNADLGAGDLFDQAAQKVRKAMKDELILAAQKSGNPAYVEAMEVLSDKLAKLQAMKGYLGGTSATRGRRAESFVNNLFGKNKDDARRVLDDLQDIFDEDFIRDAKLANMAEQLGPGGIPGFLPQQTTGRSAVGLLGGASGLIGGSSAGNVPAMVSGGAFLGLTSPKIASGLLGTADILGKAGGLASDVTEALLPFRGSGAASRIIVSPEEREKLSTEALRKIRFK